MRIHQAAPETIANVVKQYLQVSAPAIRSTTIRLLKQVIAEYDHEQ